MKVKYYFRKIVKFLPVLFFLIFAPEKIAGAVEDYGLSKTAGEAGLPTSNTAAAFLGQVGGAVLAIAGSIFLFLMIYGGIILMTGIGDTDRITKGKKIITWAIIGAVVLGGAYALTALIFQAIGQ